MKEEEQVKPEVWHMPESKIEPEKPLLAPEGLSYLPYQEVGIRRLLRRTSNLLGDEMGLGKTIEAIGYLNQLSNEVQSTCIVTPTFLRYNWLTELDRWIVRDRIRVIGFSPEADPLGLEIAIVPYSQLEEIPDHYAPDLLIVDEAHYVKNPEAQRTRNFIRLAKRVKRKLFMTGTPIENRVRDLWTLLQILDPETWDPPGFLKGHQVGTGEGAGWFNFAKRHCGGRLIEIVVGYDKVRKMPIKRKMFTFDGSTHLDELNQKLRTSGLLTRRLKAEVLTELPEKRRQIVVLPPPDDENVLKNEHEAFARTGLDYASDISDLSKATILFADLAAARKATGLAKVTQAIQHIQNCLDGGASPLVVFAHHKEIVWKLSEAFSTLEPSVCTGDDSDEMRDRAVQRFQKGETTLFLGTMGAAGVGLTLTAASNMVFVEMQWKLMDQVEDRIHRLGQKNACLYQYLVHDWSVDSNMLKLIWKKQKIVETALK